MNARKARQLFSALVKRPGASWEALGLMLATLLLTSCSGAPPGTAVLRTDVPPTTVARPTATALPPLSGSGGGRIAFSSRRDGNYEIYVMNADGTDQRRLTKTPHDEEGGAAWSPDCTQIAFSSSRESGGRVRVMHGDGSNKRWLTAGPGTSPAWSPDGTRISFTRQGDGSDIYVMNTDGSDQERLTHTSADGGDTLAFDPDWSSDGTHIVCVVEFNPDDQLFGETTIHIFNAGDVLQSSEGADLQPLPRAGSSFNDWPSWSPQGSQIAFSAVSIEGGGHRDIYVVNADGTGLRQLTYTDSFDELAPAWSPDGTRIAFQANPDGNWDIFVMDADGTNQVALTTDTESDVDPAWCH